jgi:hypothetical protein
MVFLLPGSARAKLGQVLPHFAPPGTRLPERGLAENKIAIYEISLYKTACLFSRYAVIFLDNPFQGAAAGKFSLASKERLR